MRRAVSLQEKLVSEDERQTVLEKSAEKHFKAIDCKSWKPPWKSSNPNSTSRRKAKVMWEAFNTANKWQT